MSLLSLHALSHTFANGCRAVKEVTFAIEEGEFIVLAGKNGSGKTVLAKHCNGLLMPTSGSIRFRDRPLEEDLTLVRQKVGFVFQNPLHQCIGQTVWDDVAFGPHNLGLAPEEIDQRVRDALAGVGFSTAELSELYQLHPALLSGGQQRKLAIAGVLAMYPQLIILDEPLAGLDYPGVKEILSQIIRLHQEGHTILIITHDVEKMLAHATRLTIMDEGSIVADDAPPKVYHLLEDHGVRCRCREASKIAEMTWIH